MKPNVEGRGRVVIEGVKPEVDAGRFPIKRVVGETVRVEADVFGDGHDVLDAVLRYRPVETQVETQEDPDEKAYAEHRWHEVQMEPLVNDRWRAEFPVDRVGRYRYTILGWVDRFLTWLHDLEKRVNAGQVSGVDLQIGVQLLEATEHRIEGEPRQQIDKWGQRLRSLADVLGSKTTTLLPAQSSNENIASAEDSANVLAALKVILEEEELEHLMRSHAARDFATLYERELEVVVDRKRAGFSAWYEMFPRSAADEPGRHGTLKDVQNRLPYVAAMGFDVLYLPPIHPVGQAFRKGKNNATEAAPDDVGSPWGIGSEEGGHKAIHPQLGTFEDFAELVEAARFHGIEIALDVAFQCSPDHPYVKEHPEWFRVRPDGTIQYAENPPKKYQDIFPFDFENENWQGQWRELKSIFDFWIERGVKIFRVDNPHTKPFPFWEWCINEIKQQHPDVLFLAEAFTRPKIMYRLAKLGFSQSYTYFSWRNTKEELAEYLTELTTTEVKDFFRPNFWPNTPDILTEHLQVGGRPAFMSRLVLAATMTSNYGIYGPPFEHYWSAPLKPGSEEYLNSEKYQVHYHDLDRPDSLKEFIGRVNTIRRQHEALHTTNNVQFHHVDNEQLLAYSKSTDDNPDVLLMVVNVDPHHRHSGFVTLPLDEFGIRGDESYQVHDLLSDARYLWNGPRNYVELSPWISPAHIFRIGRPGDAG